MRVSLILPAAGKGTRFSAGGVASASKIEYPLEDRAVFLHTLDRFVDRPEICQALLAVDPDRFDEFSFRWQDQLEFMNVKLIAGGRAERWETVKLALAQVSEEATHIAVHDAARCLTPRDVIERVFDEASRRPAVVPALAVSDTLKRARPLTAEERAEAVDVADDILGLSDAGSEAAISLQRVEADVPRAGLWAMQTPQVFEKELLQHAYDALHPSNAKGITDDAAVVQRIGEPVVLVEGDPRNIKLTRPGDAELAAALLSLEKTRRSEQDALDLLADEDDDLI